MSQPKSPLDGVTEAIARMTPQELEEWKQSAKKRVEEIEKDAEDERNGTGKYAPPTGVCVFCSGEVVAKITNEYRGDIMHRIIGPGGRNQVSRVHNGWHCTKCGLRYEFPPNNPGARNKKL